jgi:hypothetical protein
MEGRHALHPVPTGPPPRLLKAIPQIPLAHVWETLPPPGRKRTLLTLTRLIAQQLPSPRAGKEVNHERP